MGLNLNDRRTQVGITVVLGALIVGGIVLTVMHFVRSDDDSGKIPAIVYFKCAQCGHQFDMKRIEFDRAQSGSDDGSVKPHECPACKKKTAHPMQLCPACGKPYLSMRITNPKEFEKINGHEKCPNCQVDIPETWNKKARGQK